MPPYLFLLKDAGGRVLVFKVGLPNKPLTFMFHSSCSRRYSRYCSSSPFSASSHTPSTFRNPPRKDGETEARGGLESQRGRVERAETKCRNRAGGQEGGSGNRQLGPHQATACSPLPQLCQSLPLEEGLSNRSQGVLSRVEEKELASSPLRCQGAEQPGLSSGQGTQSRLPSRPLESSRKVPRWEPVSRGRSPCPHPLSEAIPGPPLLWVCLH